MIRCAGVGLDPAKTRVTFTSTQGTLGPYALNAVPAATQWPPTGGNQAGQPITIEITTPFNSAIAMFWPGSEAGPFYLGHFSRKFQRSDSVLRHL